MLTPTTTPTRTRTRTERQRDENVNEKANENYDENTNEDTNEDTNDANAKSQLTPKPNNLKFNQTKPTFSSPVRGQWRRRRTTDRVTLRVSSRVWNLPKIPYRRDSI